MLKNKQKTFLWLTKNLVTKSTSIQFLHNVPILDVQEVGDGLINIDQGDPPVLQIANDEDNNDAAQVNNDLI